MMVSRMFRRSLGWHRWCISGLSLVLLMGLITVHLNGCSGEISVALPGCESCSPDKCLSSGNSHKCVECLNDKQCQSDVSPDKKCQNNKCVCGTDRDCAQGQRCLGNPEKGVGGCVQCIDDKDCKGDKGVCAFNECVTCRPRATQSCEPSDIKACKKGTQECTGSGSWTKCEGWVACAAGEKCVEEKCVPDCPEPAPCKEEGNVCTTDTDVLPGKFKVCSKNAKGCFELGDEKSCGDREYCAKSSCIPFTCPQPECKLGDSQCVDGKNMRVCVKTDKDCLKWGEATACKAEEQCRLTTNRCTVCDPKTKQVCYDGKEETKNKGVCRAGEQTCEDDGSKWSDCKGQVLASTEQCNGLDDDCDGQIDNNLTPETCPNQTGSCSGAVKRCEGNKGWQDCVASDYQKVFKEYEAKETLCDGKDNDCNGKIDDGLTAPACEKTTGVCQGAVKTCDGANGWLPCDKAHYLAHDPAYEETETRCDGKDNDCNGKTDEAFTDLGTNCTVGKGECVDTGKVICKTDGSATQCSGTEKTPSKETCNGKDDDCDGQIDNNLTPEPCANQTGPCSGAVKRCEGTKGWQNCVASDYQKAFKEYEAKETLCDGKDNDCNGKIDDGLTAPACEKTVGVCQGTVKICGGSKGWLPCDKTVYLAKNPAYEEVEKRCDGLDNDCNGKTDEIHTTLGTNCTVGIGECKDSGKIICKTDGSGTQCSAKAGTATNEQCNGKDDNCNGSIDEGLSRKCYTGSAGCDSNFVCKGSCKSGTQTCANGSWGSCVGEVKNTTETCNGKDDDCNGSVDENWASTLGKSCTVGTGECKRTGTYVCTGNGTGTECSAKPGPTASEVCNGRDDNCNGQVDDGASCSRGQECSSGACRTCSQPGDTVFAVSCSLSCRCGLTCTYLDCWTPPIGPRICAKIGCR